MPKRLGDNESIEDERCTRLSVDDHKNKFAVRTVMGVRFLKGFNDEADGFNDIIAYIEYLAKTVMLWVRTVEDMQALVSALRKAKGHRALCGGYICHSNSIRLATCQIVSALSVPSTIEELVEMGAVPVMPVEPETYAEVLKVLATVFTHVEERLQTVYAAAEFTVQQLLGFETAEETPETLYNMVRMVNAIVFRVCPDTSDILTAAAAEKVDKHIDHVCPLTSSLLFQCCERSGITAYSDYVLETADYPDYMILDAARCDAVVNGSSGKGLERIFWTASLGHRWPETFCCCPSPAGEDLLKVCLEALSKRPNANRETYCAVETLLLMVSREPKESMTEDLAERALHTMAAFAEATGTLPDEAVQAIDRWSCMDPVVYSVVRCMLQKGEPIRRLMDSIVESGAEGVRSAENLISLST